jgi:hypothetical protein
MPVAPGVAVALIRSRARRPGRHVRPSLARRAVAWAWGKARTLWAALPGPTWVKALLVVACLLIPGPFDEIACIALAGYLAARRAARRSVTP